MQFTKLIFLNFIFQTPAPKQALLEGRPISRTWWAGNERGKKNSLTSLSFDLLPRLFVTCDIKGHIKFYDGDLQLTHWYSQFKLGSIRSFSFSKTPASPEDITKYPESCTLSGIPFIIR